MNIPDQLLLPEGSRKLISGTNITMSHEVRPIHVQPRVRHLYKTKI
jgi:hypothetical protein